MFLVGLFERDDGVAAQLDAPQKSNNRSFPNAVSSQQLVQCVDGWRRRPIECQEDVALP
jgi:hypothetical protein